MTLSIVPVANGLAGLGSWGTLTLTGPTSALLQLAWADDIQVPDAVARDVTGGVLLLNDEIGRLLFLPYAGDLALAYDLKNGSLVASPIAIPRDPDCGGRMASVRVLPGRGAIHLTESTLACFRADCTLAWRVDEDLAGWTIEGSTVDELYLLAGDWSGDERRQTRSILDGEPLS